MATSFKDADVNATRTGNETWRQYVPAGSRQDAVAADADDTDASRYHVYVMLTVYIIVFLFGVFGNTLVITIVVKYSAIRNKSISNYYILNLAAADELLLCTIPFFCISTYTSDWMFGEIVCKLSYVFRESNKYTGILTLVALSVDRCLASYHNSTALRRVRVGVAVCAAVWIASFLACLPYAIYATVTVVGARRSCRLGWELTVQSRRVWTYSQLALALVAPLAVITGANAVLLWRLRRRSARRSGNGTDSSRTTATGSLPSFGPIAMAKLVIVVVGVFVGCQLPYHMIEVMSLMTYERYSADGSEPSSTYKTVFVYANIVSQLLVYVSSCCNPIIYGIFNKNYRKRYIIGKRKPKNLNSANLVESYLFAVLTDISGDQNQW